MKSAALAFLALCVALAAGEEIRPPNRIVGGSVTTISQYPYSAALLHNQRGSSSWYTQWCGGAILTSNTILSAAHCFVTNWAWHQAGWWRVRVGSALANSGGVVHNVQRYVAHPNYDGRDSDVIVLRTATTITYVTNTVQPVSIAGANYNLGDNQVVWAIGWGATSSGGPSSEQLRHVQVWTVNQEICRQRYGSSVITNNMLCSGWLDVGGRDQCQGDSGGPLLHNGVAVGICSFGNGCALARYPGVNARVSAFSNWIVNTVNSI